MMDRVNTLVDLKQMSQADKIHAPVHGLYVGRLRRAYVLRKAR